MWVCVCVLGEPGTGPSVWVWVCVGGCAWVCVWVLGEPCTGPSAECDRPAKQTAHSGRQDPSTGL